MWTREAIPRSTLLNCHGGWVPAFCQQGGGSLHLTSRGVVPYRQGVWLQVSAWHCATGLAGAQEKRGVWISGGRFPFLQAGHVHENKLANSCVEPCDRKGALAGSGARCFARCHFLWYFLGFIREELFGKGSGIFSRSSHTKHSCPEMIRCSRSGPSCWSIWSHQHSPASRPSVCWKLMTVGPSLACCSYHTLWGMVFLFTWLQGPALLLTLDITWGGFPFHFFPLALPLSLSPSHSLLLFDSLSLIVSLSLLFCHSLSLVSHTLFLSPISLSPSLLSFLFKWIIPNAKSAMINIVPPAAFLSSCLPHPSCTRAPRAMCVCVPRPLPIWIKLWHPSSPARSRFPFREGFPRASYSHFLLPLRCLQSQRLQTVSCLREWAPELATGIPVPCIMAHCSM